MAAGDEEALGPAEIARRLAGAGVSVDERVAAGLATFVALLLRWNKVYNLTGPRGAGELLDICRPLTAPGSILLLLTATHLQEAFRGLAADFVLRPLPAEGPKLKSSIVLLERVEA